MPKRNLALAFIAMAFLAILATYVLLRFAYSPLSLNQNEHTISIQKGMSVRSVLNMLQKESILTPFQVKQFFLWIKFHGVEKSIKAGTYLLEAQVTPDQLMRKLVEGDVVQYALTIIEGHTAEDLLGQLQAHPAIVKTLTTLSEKEILRLLETDYPALEGIFFPDTYYFPAQTKDITVLKMAYQTMQQHLKRAWQHRGEPLAVKTPYEALILASIIEKEGQLHEEHSQISGVFHRRLFKKMRLQADPTVLYGLPIKPKEISKNDLKNEHPYNTYVHHHLPPTPIALPGLKAIKAALNPDDGQALYFVAKGDGSHYFSDTLEAHNKAVKKYQRSNIVQEESSE